MSVNKMHADQVSTDAALVRRLVRAQFPQWADLAVEPVDSDGTANANYRLGDRMAVRVPIQIHPVKTEQLEKEHLWLPQFAPELPLAIPVPLGKGEPSADYPGPWTICDWIEGENPTLDRLHDPSDAARSLAQFLHALQQIDPTSGPPPGDHNFQRGVPLANRDDRTREAIADCAALVDATHMAAAWDRDLHAPTWDRPPVWLHGDLAPGNLLAAGGRLVAVIDWGGLGVGDPAIELLPAWNLFEDGSRDAYRVALGVDDATWARGRGLALSQAIVALQYYMDTSPAIVRWARRMVAEVLEDHERSD